MKYLLSAPFRRFLLRETALALAICIAGLFLFTGILKEFYLDIFPVLLTLFYLVTTLVHLLLLKAGQKEPGKFITGFMVASLSKLLFYLVGIVIYLLLRRENAASFLVAVIFLYLVFTVFEVLSILAALRKNIDR